MAGTGSGPGSPDLPHGDLLGWLFSPTLSYDPFSDQLTTDLQPSIEPGDIYLTNLGAEQWQGGATATATEWSRSGSMTAVNTSNSSSVHEGYEGTGPTVRLVRPHRQLCID